MLPSAEGRTRSGARSPGDSCDTVVVSHCAAAPTRAPSVPGRPPAPTLRTARTIPDEEHPCARARRFPGRHHLRRHRGRGRGRRRRVAAPGPHRAGRVHRRRPDGRPRRPRSSSRCRCSTSRWGSARPATSWAARSPRSSSGRGRRSSAWPWWSPCRPCCSPTAGSRPWARTCCSSASSRSSSATPWPRPSWPCCRSGPPPRCPPPRSARSSPCPPPPWSSSASTPSAAPPSSTCTQLTTFMLVWHLAIGVGEARHHRPHRRGRRRDPSRPGPARPALPHHAWSSPTPTARSREVSRRARSADGRAPDRHRWVAGAFAVCLLLAGRRVDRGPAPTRTAWSTWPSRLGFLGTARGLRPGRRPVRRLRRRRDRQPVPGDRPGRGASASSSRSASRCSSPVLVRPPVAAAAASDDAQTEKV